MNHVVLLGDSVFDNAAYVPRGTPVIRHLQAELGPSWKASLLAVDGSVTRQVADQIEDLPDGSTHLVVSAGGNDALQQASVLLEEAQSVGAVLRRMSETKSAFAQDYQGIVASLLARRKPVPLCTIYYPCFENEELQRASVAALPVFNDCIIRTAVAYCLPLLDLQSVCNEQGDHVHEIEPSDAGGLKIARAVKSLLLEHDFAASKARIYV